MQDAGRTERTETQGTRLASGSLQCRDPSWSRRANQGINIPRSPEVHSIDKAVQWVHTAGIVHVIRLAGFYGFISRDHAMRSVKWCSSVVMAISLAAGCEDSGYQDYSDAPLSDSRAHDRGHGHGASGHSGKHGGVVLELDDAHGHHAELVFDKATRDVTLYFYGREIGVAKAATGLAFEVRKDDQEVVLGATPSPLEGEAAETCSRFVIAGSQLSESITSLDQLAGHFHVIINGKEFVGTLPGHGDADHNDAHPHQGSAHDKEVAEKDDHLEGSPGKVAAPRTP